jgi:predicted dehydrogenase
MNAAHDRTEPLAMAVIGCGDVALHRYLPYLTGENLLVRLATCADLDERRAFEVAQRFGLRACPVPDAMADPDVDLVLNLTPPLAHEEINAGALRAGKHVYSEKPFAVSYEAGRKLVSLAASVERRLASAPDTILGPNIQLARELIERGKIGRPFMASMSFATADRSWHPDPAFFYRAGAGPVFDEGPYFLSALVALLGPVREVFAQAATYHEEMIVPSGPRQGARYRAEVPTSYVGGLVLRSGVLVSLLLSFDVRGTTLPPLEIYGEDGTLRLAFPGYYNGPVVFGREHDHIDEVIHPTWRTEIDEARGIGVEELAAAIRAGNRSRLEGDFPLHVLEVMEALVKAGETSSPMGIRSVAQPPRPYSWQENPRNRSCAERSGSRDGQLPHRGA